MPRRGENIKISRKRYGTVSLIYYVVQRNERNTEIYFHAKTHAKAHAKALLVPRPSQARRSQKGASTYTNKMGITT